MDGGWVLETSDFCFHALNAVSKKQGSYKQGSARHSIRHLQNTVKEKWRNNPFFSFILCTLLVNKLDHVGAASSCICFSPHTQNLQNYEL